MPIRRKITPQISVIIPAFNEGLVIGNVIKNIRAAVNKLDKHHEIIVIDDGSADNTMQSARDAGAIVIQHPYNIGNGAAVKTGIRHARGKILVTIDGDGQHDPNDIIKLVNQIGPY